LHLFVLPNFSHILSAPGHIVNNTFQVVFDNSAGCDLSKPTSCGPLKKHAVLDGSKSANRNFRRKRYGYLPSGKLRLSLQVLRHLLDFVEDAEEVATPEFCDLFFGVAAADELEGDVKGFAGVVPALDAPAAVKV
jgi:hypothetical protein